VRRPQRSTQIQAHIPAPVGGLNTVSPGYQMPDLDCPVLYNLVGAENGLRSRFGYKEWCTGVGSSTVATIMPFAGSTTSGSKDKLFATSTGTAKIYDVSASSATPSLGAELRLLGRGCRLGSVALGGQLGRRALPHVFRRGERLPRLHGEH
jgi:hypothetical protein